MTEAAISRFPQQLRDIVFADARVLSGLDDNALATTVTDWAHEQHGEREGQLLSRCTVVLVIRARYNAARTLAAARSPEDTAPSI